LYLLNNNDLVKHFSFLLQFSPVCRQAQEIQDYLIRTKKEQDTVAIPENSEDKSRK
jgi:hypothetical protein